MGTFMEQADVEEAVALLKSKGRQRRKEQLLRRRNCQVRSVAGVEGLREYRLVWCDKAVYGLRGGSNPH